VTVELERITGAQERASAEHVVAPRALALLRSRAVYAWTSFFAALQFLTVFPAVVRRPFTGKELGWSLAFFPLVGGLLGALLLGLNQILSLAFPPTVSAALILTVWILATGALHFDGFLDTCDGLFGGRTPEERLRIMRDEHVGAFAVIGGILLILVKYQILVSLVDVDSALILVPVLGRWSMVLAVVLFPYARDEGLGRDMKDHAGWSPLLAATALALVAAWWASAWLGLLCAGIVLLALFGGAIFILRRVPGFTGDIYGFLCELFEVLVLLTLVAGDNL
jgi:adenosylcobinamide-GDP ribazoletransferase